MEAERSEAPWRRDPGKVIVVLPAYNESGNLGPLLEQIDQTMHEERQRYSVIVVDDGSNDDTLSVARQHAEYMPLRVERHAVNQGLGATIRDGLGVAASLCSERDIVVVMDADNSHAPGLIRRMTREIHEGADVVIASRYQRGAYVRGLPLHRRLLSWGGSRLLKLFFPIPGVRDYTCGYRAYRGPVLREAFEKYGSAFIDQEGFQCTVDILLKLRDMNVIVREVPVILRYDLKEGTSKMKILRTTVNTLALMLRRLLGLPG